MSHLDVLSRFVLLPELELKRWFHAGGAGSIAVAEKRSEMEVCPKCATPSRSVYDHREVKLKDSPIRGNAVRLVVRKRRFYCHTCRKPFTEPLQGVRKGQRTTWRYRNEVLWACENFVDLNRVRRALRCSTGFIYTVLYERLKERIKQNINYPWPSIVGIDEHFFTRRKNTSRFATVFTDFNNGRLREVVHGKTREELISALSDIPGRENVKNVVLDLCDSFKSFAREFFPNAKLVADKFHVLRLINPTLNKYRLEVTGDKRKNPVRKLLLRNRSKLEYHERGALDRWLQQHPTVRQVYEFKEALHRFYRIRGVNKARRVLTRLTDAMALSALPEIKKLRKTLMKWRNEILAYFETRLTNAKTEGFNNVAKLVQKRAYGYRNFENYRLRLLNACT